MVYFQISYHVRLLFIRLCYSWSLGPSRFHSASPNITGVITVSAFSILNLFTLTNCPISPTDQQEIGAAAEQRKLDVIDMDLCTSIRWRSPSFRSRLPYPATFNSPTPHLNSRLKISLELQTPVGVNGRADSYSPSVSTHKVTVHDRQRGVFHEFMVPEDQYILHTAEPQDITLPFACRHGCCTSCAVRVKSGELRQPEALGISLELKSQGYALLCVGYPSTDLEVETQDEDEVYWLQFGRYFARGPIERDDYALELAMADE